jgi:exopolyphosphatase / guanosine-5'-triphosphate,3'-diphosphate pyrophosphatase
MRHVNLMILVARDVCGAMIAAAIDIGTNSIKLVVGEKNPSGAACVLHEAVTITRLGENLGLSRRIGPDAARRTLEGIRGLVADARNLGADTIRAVATSAMRDAANGEDFIAAVQARTGVRIEVISGREEARLTRSAVVLDTVLGSFEGGQVTVDVGGGSTEFTFPFCSGGISNPAQTEGDAVSVDLGAVRLHERFIKHDAPLAEELQSAAECAEEMLKAAALGTGNARVVAMGGSAVNLARMLRAVPCEDFAQVHGVTITAQDIAGMVDRLAGLRTEQRRTIVGLDPERADIILTGAIILGAVLTVLGRDEMVVSVRGVRHGLLYEMLDGQHDASGFR